MPYDLRSPAARDGRGAATDPHRSAVLALDNGLHFGHYAPVADSDRRSRWSCYYFRGRTGRTCGGSSRSAASYIVALLTVALYAISGCSSDAALTTSSDATSKSGPVEDSKVEQAVIVDLRLTGGDFGSDEERQALVSLEDQPIVSIESAGVGVYDGNEFGGGGVTLYAYGPDADALFAAMERPLREFRPNPGSSATIRYGGPESVDQQVVPLP